MKSITMQKTDAREKVLEVRLAENQLEIERTLALRYEVFNLELGEGLPESAETRKDRDPYDLYCDHLIVLDRSAENRIVGTYRLLRRKIAQKNIGFYSENEFDLKPIHALEEEVAELGRSCVHPDYRDGSVFPLLWKGIAEYVKHYRVRYLMGCGSVHSADPGVASSVHAYFRHRDAFAPEDLRVMPVEAFRMKGFQSDLEIHDLAEVSDKVPPLLKGYLRVGARIGGEPAFDPVFRTTDFFILFDSHKINDRYGKRYGI